MSNLKVYPIADIQKTSSYVHELFNDPFYIR